MEFMPSPPWGRWWLATGVLISRVEPGEGVYPSLYYAALSKTGFFRYRALHGWSFDFRFPRGQWCHWEWDPFRKTGHFREGGNPIRKPLEKRRRPTGFPPSRE